MKKNNTRLWNNKDLKIHAFSKNFFGSGLILLTFKWTRPRGENDFPTDCVKNRNTNFGENELRMKQILALYRKKKSGPTRTDPLFKSLIRARPAQISSGCILMN